MGQHQGPEGFPGPFHALDFSLCIIVINFNVLASNTKPSPGVRSPCLPGCLKESSNLRCSNWSHHPYPEWFWVSSKPHLPPFLLSKSRDTSYLQVTTGVTVRARRRHGAAQLPWQQASTQEGPRGSCSSLVQLASPGRREEGQIRKAAAAELAARGQMSRRILA